MRKRKETEIDIENLNRVIVLSKKILKVLFVVVILACALLAVVLFDKFNLGNIILNVLSVAAPLFIGFVVAWLLNPAVTFLNKKGAKRGLGSVFVFAMFLIVVFLIIKFMLPMLYKQINEFIEIIPSLFLQVTNFIHENFLKLNATGFDFTGVETKIYDALENFGADLTTKLPSLIIGGVSSVISSVWALLLGFIVGFYLLIDFD